MEFAAGLRFPDLVLRRFDRDGGGFNTGDRQKEVTSQSRLNGLVVVVGNIPRDRTAPCQAHDFLVAHLRLADNFDWAEPTVGIFRSRQENRRGRFVGFNFGERTRDARRQTFDAELDLTIEIVVPKCHHFDGHGFAAPKKRRPKRGLFRVLVDRRRRLGQSDEPEIGRFSAQRQAVNKTRIAFVAIEQVADFQPVGPVLLHFKSPGPVAARRVEFRTAEVGVRGVKLVGV